MQSSYPQSSYPVLQPAEILETCRGVGLNLVAGDLNHPTPVQAQNIYAFWLHLILDISVDDIISATNERLDLLPDPVRPVPPAPSSLARLMLFSRTGTLPRSDLHRRL